MCVCVCVCVCACACACVCVCVCVCYQCWGINTVPGMGVRTAEYTVLWIACKLPTAEGWNKQVHQYGNRPITNTNS